MSLDRSLAGAQIELVRTNDPYTHLKPGAIGTVQFIDDVGTIHVRWDDGSNLGLIVGEDSYHITNPEKEPDTDASAH